YNFRLTPWANSDNRNFQQTTSGLEDYSVDGTKAVKLALNYNFASWNLPELTAGIGGNYGTNVRSSLTEKEYDGSMHSFDWNIGYKFMDGALEGLNIRTFRSKFRGDDIVHKADRNDTKVLISYSVKLK
ncbi:OprD family outer membrane porin, partial [Vibrio vulnificus]|uniref:OprD family outer membrane porin n=2 Tax=Vibrio TaxID=662 RepID=UPI000D483DCD